MLAFLQERIVGRHHRQRHAPLLLGGSLVQTEIKEAVGLRFSQERHDFVGHEVDDFDPEHRGVDQEVAAFVKH